jgi:hypothetical protein
MLTEAPKTLSDVVVGDCGPRNLWSPLDSFTKRLRREFFLKGIGLTVERRFWFGPDNSGDWETGYLSVETEYRIYPGRDLLRTLPPLPESDDGEVKTLSERTQQARNIENESFGYFRFTVGWAYYLKDAYGAEQRIFKRFNGSEGFIDLRARDGSYTSWRNREFRGFEALIKSMVNARKKCQKEVNTIETAREEQRERTKKKIRAIDLAKLLERYEYGTSRYLEIQSDGGILLRPTSVDRYQDGTLKESDPFFIRNGGRTSPILKITQKAKDWRDQRITRYSIELGGIDLQTIEAIFQYIRGESKAPTVWKDPKTPGERTRPKMIFGAEDPQEIDLFRNIPRMTFDEGEE